jgi:WD40 repeat protein
MQVHGARPAAMASDILARNYRTRVLGVLLTFVMAWLAPRMAVATDYRRTVELQMAQMDDRSRQAVMTPMPETGPKIIDDELRVISSKYPVAAVTWSPSGRNLLTSDLMNSTVQLWDVATGALLHEARKKAGGTTPVSLFTPDGRYIVTASVIRTRMDSQTTVSVLDANTLAVLKNIDGPYHDRGHSNAAAAIALNRDGRLFAVAHVGGPRDNAISIYDTVDWALKKVLDPPLQGKSVTSMVFDPRGNRLAVATLQGGVEIWDVDAGKRVVEFQAHYGYVNDLAYSPDGKMLATAASVANDGPDSEKNKLHHSGDSELIRVWNADSRVLIRSYVGPFATVQDVSFSHDGRYLLTVCEDHAIRIWDPNSPNLVESINLGRAFPFAAAFSPDETSLAFTIGSTVKIVKLKQTVQQK